MKQNNTETKNILFGLFPSILFPILTFLTSPIPNNILLSSSPSLQEWKHPSQWDGSGGSGDRSPSLLSPHPPPPPCSPPFPTLLLPFVAPTLLLHSQLFVLWSYLPSFPLCPRPLFPFPDDICCPLTPTLPASYSPYNLLPSLTGLPVAVGGDDIAVRLARCAHTFPLSGVFSPSSPSCLPGRKDLIYSSYAWGGGRDRGIPPPATCDAPPVPHAFPSPPACCLPPLPACVPVALPPAGGGCREAFPSSPFSHWKEDQGGGLPWVFPRRQVPPGALPPPPAFPYNSLPLPHNTIWRDPTPPGPFLPLQCLPALSPYLLLPPTIPHPFCPTPPPPGSAWEEEEGPHPLCLHHLQ